MAAKQSNKRDFHGLSEEEEVSESENGLEEDSRFTAIPNKRRRLSDVDNEASDVSQDESDGEDEEHDTRLQLGSEATTEQDASRTKVKPLTPAQLAASQRKAKKTGVMYISRVPPFMKPATLRKLLSPYGEINRIFLTPEPTPVYQRRVRAGGNKKKSFVDGWVEFTSKKRAKACVEMLNGRTVGGKKSGFYHDDIWNLKYLKGFKWSDLMEQVQIEERTREGRLRAELQKEAKERKAFLTNLDIATKDQRKALAETKDKELGSDRDGQGLTGERSEPRISKPRFERRFKQTTVKQSKHEAEGPENKEVHRVLRTIF